MKKTLFTLGLSLSLCFISGAQNINIPDANFKSALLNISQLNIIDDGEISNFEASSYNGVINVSNLGISDLTGISAFTGNITLNCAGNQLTTLDLSSNTNMSGHLHVEGNVLTSIVMPNSINVTQFTYSSNNITSLDLSNTPGITTMWGLNNPLTSINLSNSSAMEGMNIDGNNLTSIDLTNLTNLQWISTSSSALTSLDISSCTVLNNLYCQYSTNLAELNMANGNNMSFPPNWFDARNCPNLTCIEVDNVAFANAAWTSVVDPGVTFSLDCGSSVPMATSMTIQGQGGINSITSPSGTLQMEATILPANANQSVQWGISSGNQYASIDANGLLTAIANGVVTVAAMTTDGSNIYQTSNIAVSNQTTGLHEISMNNAVKIYPNPASETIRIKTNMDYSTIAVYQFSGEFVFETTAEIIDVSSLSPGVYFILINSENGMLQQRFIKK